MSWTTPKTWAPGEALTADDMNTYVKDNTNFLFDRPSAIATINEALDFTVAAGGAFVDVDPALSLTLTTVGAHIHVSGSFSVKGGSVNTIIHFNLAVDGVNLRADDGIAVCKMSATNQVYIVSITELLTPEEIPAGVHTITLRWKTVTGTGTMYAGAGTGTADVHPTFWAHSL